jgi:hypothetical protein
VYYRDSATKSQHVLYVPEHFDPDLVLNKCHDEARWFVHSIFLRRVLDRRDKDVYVPLHSRILKKMMGDRAYQKIIDALKWNGVIECDGIWTRTEKSKGYRLTPFYRDMRHRKYVLDPDGQMAAKMSWWRQHRRNEVTLDVHQHLRDQFDRLQIDLPNDLVLQPETAQQVEMILDREWYFIPCQYGRVHTNLSSLDSGLRKYLRVDGRPLVNLDIRNSQPLLACVLLLMYYSNGCSLASIHSFKANEHGYMDPGQSMFTNQVMVGDNEGEEFPSPSPPSPHTLSGAIPNNDQLDSLPLPDDVKEYIGVTQRGEMYDHLMRRWGIPPGGRDEFKQDFFGQVMYCRDHRRYEYGRLFERDFPNVVEVFEVLKAKDYTQAAKLMQRVESSLMINRVARRVMKELPDAPVFTIHDSVVTLREYADPVYRILRQEYARVGLHPTVRYEDYEGKLAVGGTA